MTDYKAKAKEYWKQEGYCKQAIACIAEFMEREDKLLSENERLKKQVEDYQTELELTKKCLFQMQNAAIQLAQRTENIEFFGTYRKTLEEGWECLHDVMVAIEDRPYEYSECLDVFKSLPTSLKQDALRWGLRDTVVKDNIFLYLKETNWKPK